MVGLGGRLFFVRAHFYHGLFALMRREMDMKRFLNVVSVAVLAITPLSAGVVFEIETKDHDSSPPRTESVAMLVEGRNLKSEPGTGGKRSEMTMIYRGDRREMVVVDHDKKNYFVMDQEMMKKMADQMGQAMRQMQEALKNVPEGQRAMVEKMMKQRMPAMKSPQRPASEVRKTAERAELHGYSCVKYEVLRGGRKIKDLWVTDWANVEGGSDVMGVFRDMAAFFSEMLESFSSAGPGLSQTAGDTVFQHMNELDGFPVVTKDYGDDGSLKSESALHSAKQRAVDPAEFEPPAGYKRQKMMGGR